VLGVAVVVEEELPPQAAINSARAALRARAVRGLLTTGIIALKP
jgi:hypothetical protein